MKKCPCCNRLLPFSKFDKSKNRKYGLHSYCKECRKQKNAEYRKTEKYKETQNKYHKSDKCKQQRKVYYRTFMKKWRATLEGRMHLREYRLKRFYGLTSKEHYQLWVTQNGKCDLCGKPTQYESVHTDHNHITNELRGLICARCNHALGLFYVDEGGIETLQKAIDYLQRHED